MKIFCPRHGTILHAVTTWYDLRELEGVHPNDVDPSFTHYAAVRGESPTCGCVWLAYATQQKSTKTLRMLDQAPTPETVLELLKKPLDVLIRSCGTRAKAALVDITKNRRQTR